MTSGAMSRYLKCAYEMSKGGVKITPKNLAERMEVRRPTAFEFIKKMESQGYLRREGREYVLTDLGELHAERILRNHRIIETLLYRAGVKLEEACNLASMIEDSISDEEVECICEYLGDPKTCPHGYPIPRGEKLALH